MAIPGTAKLGPQLVKLARSFHCSTVKHAGSTWRLKHGLPENPSDRGLTTDLPDWSFADGRPAPPMAGHVRRLEKQREIVTQTRGKAEKQEAFVRRDETSSWPNEGQILEKARKIPSWLKRN
ncbi:large ribosomal subunit protein mL52 isoform X2 [Erythrolamprus reginae]|uniref:large ribosomal subunit protein mL52 isoform X2 n=1 Tax=Erythrolamprus reginae TaxID=121349 RepID=UPI00396D05D7